MPQVETVTGPIEASELGTTLIHEHLRTRDEAVHFQWPDAHGLGRNPERRPPGPAASTGGDRGGQAALELGDQDDLRSDRDVPRPRRRLHAQGRRGDRAPGRPLHRDLHLRPPAAVLRQPRRPTRSPTCSSPTSSRGSRGPRSRRRSSSAPPTSPGVTENVEKVHRAAARAQPAHRRADHGPLAPGQRHRARARSRSSRRRASTSRARSRSPTPATPTTSTTSRACSRRASGSASTATGSRCTCPTTSGRRPRWRCSSAATPSGIFLSADSCATIDWFPPEVDRAAAGRRRSAKDWTIRIVPETRDPGTPRGGDDRRAGADDHGREPRGLAHWVDHPRVW